ncbi:MAG: hypothetical protein R6W72_12330 [Desulfurivibrionaceae bacterium]
MKVNLTVFLLLLLASTLTTRAEAAPDLPDYGGFSVDISGDLHGGITHEDNDSNTYYPFGLRLQASVAHSQQLKRQAELLEIKSDLPENPKGKERFPPPHFTPPGLGHFRSGKNPHGRRK